MDSVFPDRFFAGHQQVAALLRAGHLTGRPLGDPAAWPSALQALVGVLLASPLPMFVAWGPERHMLYNDGYAEILGERHPAALGRPFAEVWPEILDSVLPIMDRGYAGLATQMDDIELWVNRGGERVETHFSFLYTPVHGDAGEVAGVFCACNEITARVASDRRMENETRRQHRLFENAPGFIAITRGPDHVFEFANASYRRLVGGRDVLGKPVREALPEVATQGFNELLDNVYRGGQRFVAHHMPVQLQGPGKESLVQHFLDFIYEPITDDAGDVTGIFVQGSDVTQAHLSQEKQRLSHARFSSLLNTMSEGFLMLDESYRLIEINAEGLRIDGRPREALLGQTHWDLWPASLGTPVETAYRKAMTERVSVALTHRHVGGLQDVWLDMRIHPVFGGVAAFYRDVNDIKRAEEDLRVADRRKDEFLATLAHELRNPLAPIRAAAEMLGREGALGQHLDWCRDVITRQVRHMAWLLDDLLDVARITSGRLELKKSYAPLRTILETAVETARPLIDAKHHALSVELGSAVHALELEVDPVRIAQVLTNLLTNAAKYTEPGGHILLSVALGDDLALRVKDNGIGVPPDSLARVFEMFSQVRSSVDRAEGGLGIGLALSRGLVEMHGGRIEVRSGGLGQGAEFTVRLPLSLIDTRPPRDAASADKPVADWQALTILVADDSEDAAESLAMLLEFEGHEVVVAHHGEDAIAFAARVRPQVAILDIGMPGLNGYEVARRLRLEAWGRDLLLIAATGWGQDEDKRRAVEAGFDHHLTKPLDGTQLVASLGGWLAERRGASTL